MRSAHRRPARADRSPPRAVFISYRRADSQRWATQLSHHIGHRFGHDLVFRDVEDIAPGRKWLQVIESELARCRVFLVVIGPHWVEDANHQRRLDNPKDVLRQEVVHALRSPGTAIPVLVGGAGMPQKNDLPRALRPLHERNALVMRPSRWAADLRLLIDELHRLILPTAPRLPLERARTEVQALQDKYFSALSAGAAADALDIAREAQAYLDRALPLYPQDPILKVTRGYLFKNEAMALLDLERFAEARAALDQGEQAFRTLLRERRRDENAWNGLGSVQGVRADSLSRQGRVDAARNAARKALAFIDKALAIAPGYPQARDDRRMLESFLRALG